MNQQKQTDRDGFVCITILRNNTDYTLISSAPLPLVFMSSIRAPSQIFDISYAANQLKVIES